MLLSSKQKHLLDSDFRSYFQVMNSKWRDTSVQYRILVYKAKNPNQPIKHTKKLTPTTNKITIKKPKSTRQMYSHSWYFLPPNMHIFRAHSVISTRHRVHPTNSDVANSSRGLYPQQLQAADPPCNAQGQNYKSIQVPHV